MSRHFGYWALVLGLCTVLAWILIRSLSNVPYDPNSDELYYRNMASSIEVHGLGQYPELFRSWNADSKNWIYPSPLRVGHVLSAALLFEFAPTSFASLSGLSVAAHLLCVLSCAFFARRCFGPTLGLALSVSLGFAPLWLGSARLALQDSYLLLWSCLAVWTALECLREPRSKLWPIAFVLSFAMAVLVKETAALLGPVFVIWVAWRAWSEPGSVPLVRWAICLGSAATMVMLSLLIAAGGLEPLHKTVGIVLGSPASNPYAILYGSGPWYRYLIDYLCLSPITTLLGLGAAGALLAGRKLEVGQRECVALLILGALLLFEMSFFTKNARYLLILELSLRGLALVYLWTILPQRWRTAALALIVVGIAWADWQSFQYGWVERGLYDPLSGALFQLREILPSAPR